MKLLFVLLMAVFGNLALAQNKYAVCAYPVLNPPFRATYYDLALSTMNLTLDVEPATGKHLYRSRCKVIGKQYRCDVQVTSQFGYYVGLSFNGSSYEGWAQSWSTSQGVGKKHVVPCNVYPIP